MSKKRVSPIIKEKRLAKRFKDVPLYATLQSKLVEARKEQRKFKPKRGREFSRLKKIRIGLEYRKQILFTGKRVRGKFQAGLYPRVLRTVEKKKRQQLFDEINKIEEDIFKLTGFELILEDTEFDEFTFDQLSNFRNITLEGSKEYPQIESFVNSLNASGDSFFLKYTVNVFNVKEHEEIIHINQWVPIRRYFFSRKWYAFNIKYHLFQKEDKLSTVQDLLHNKLPKEFGVSISPPEYNANKIKISALSLRSFKRFKQVMVEDLI